MVLWKDVLEDWENGKPLKYPGQLQGRFQWNTSALKDDGNTDFLQRFRTNPELPTIQNKKDFQKKFDLSRNEKKVVISFPNLNGDTVLVVPMPIRGRNYATLRDFIDNAPEQQQIVFWKYVAKEARLAMEKWGKAWISVHGLGVAYTHVRISQSPKYYFATELI
jgi:hypothetical protein